MDILYWINLNPNIEFKNTEKIFFKKYLCRAVIFCPGGRTIHEQGPIYRNIDRRRNLYRSFNYAGSWAPRSSKSIERADIKMLETLRNIVSTPMSVRLRVEEPLIQIYGETEQDIKDFIERLDFDHQSHIKELTVPKNQEHADLLRDNKILKKTRRNNYRYRVVFKEGRLDLATKSNILKYLDSLDDIVFVPAGTRNQLSNGFTGFWGAYFYTNDPNILTFLELIHSGAIANINEIVTVE